MVLSKLSPSLAVSAEVDNVHLPHPGFSAQCYSAFTKITNGECISNKLNAPRNWLLLNSDPGYQAVKLKQK